jgi:two-component system LytT family response regulator
VRVLIVDDEEPARWRVRELMARHADVEIVGECANGREAIAAVEELRPELLVLDIQMPEVDGFGVLAAIAPDRVPLTIFVTAFDEHAVKAFETHALDYVLKPFSDERFDRALDRARARRLAQTREAWTLRVIALLREQTGFEAPADPAMSAEAGAAAGAAAGGAARADLTCLVVRSGGRSLVLHPHDIDWIEAAGVYVTVHAGEHAYLHRVALNDLESRLAHAQFVRIHRSALVNLTRIEALIPRENGQFSVVLRGGSTLRLSRRYRARLEARLGQPL